MTAEFNYSEVWPLRSERPALSGDGRDAFHRSIAQGKLAGETPTLQV